MDRRTLMAAMSTAVVGGMASAAAPASGAARKGQGAKARTVYVESEFAPLRTVVLTQSQFAMPSKAFDKPRPSFLPQDKDTPRSTWRGGDFGDANPEAQRVWEGEREAFRKVLVKHGVEVLRPELLSQAEKDATGDDGYSNFFVRDPFFTVGDNVVEGSLRFLHRRQEVLTSRKIFEQHVYPADCRYVAAPQPAAAAAGDPTLGAGPFIEGGDVVVLGKHVFVGSSGLASNEAGVRWLRKLLAPQGYTVEFVPLNPNILHLDCALGLVKEGLITVCEEALLNGVPQIIRSWDRIPVTMDEASRLATNGLPISPKVYVTDPKFRHIGDQIGRHDVEVEYIDFTISRGFGGSFRCSTQPLLRTS